MSARNPRHRAITAAAALAALLGVVLSACERQIVAPEDAATIPIGSLAALAAPPAAASLLVFDSDRSGNRDLWAMAPDGSGLRRLTDHPGFDVLADVSRHDSRIAWQSDREGPFVFRIYVMNADGSDPRRLTAANAFEASPDWHPNAARLAFDRRVAPGNQEVFVIAATGTNEEQLTSSPGFDGQPDWSPNGTRIVFTSARDGNREIYVMNADGTDQTRLTNHAAFDEAPAWSPDGRLIAFHSTRDGVLGVYIMHADGSSARRLVDDGKADASPAWSPDGRWIAFHRRVTPPNPEIHVIRADGSGGATRLTQHSGFDGFVDWARRPKR